MHRFIPRLWFIFRVTARYISCKMKVPYSRRIDPNDFWALPGTRIFCHSLWGKNGIDYLKLKLNSGSQERYNRFWYYYILRNFQFILIIQKLIASTYITYVFNSSYTETVSLDSKKFYETFSSILCYLEINSFGIHRFLRSTVHIQKPSRLITTNLTEFPVHPSLPRN